MVLTHGKKEARKMVQKEKAKSVLDLSQKRDFEHFWLCEQAGGTDTISKEIEKNPSIIDCVFLKGKYSFRRKYFLKIRINPLHKSLLGGYSHNINHIFFCRGG